MIEYLKLAKLNIKSKYQNSFFSSNILKHYYRNRNEFKKEIKNLNSKIQINKDDKTFFYLKNLYQNKQAKQNNKKIYIFYKKFETNLSLKKQYNLNYKKITNLNTSNQSYIYLGLLILKLKNLNIFQKLNSLLKINDILIINKKKIRNIDSQLMQKLINKEINLFNKINNGL